MWDYLAYDCNRSRGWPRRRFSRIGSIQRSAAITTADEEILNRSRETWSDAPLDRMLAFVD